VPLKGHTIASDWEEDRNGILARDFLYKGVWLKGGKKIWFYVTWGGTPDVRTHSVKVRVGTS
jgi:hypothetical protein